VEKFTGFSTRSPYLPNHFERVSIQNRYSIVRTIRNVEESLLRIARERDSER
jgi:hypothetical protein